MIRSGKLQYYIEDTATPLGYFWVVWPDDYDLGMKSLAQGCERSWSAAEKAAEEAMKDPDVLEEFEDWKTE